MKLQNNTKIKEQLENYNPFENKAYDSKDDVWQNVKLSKSYKGLYLSIASIVILLLLGSNIYFLDNRNSIQDQFNKRQIVATDMTDKQTKLISDLQSKNRMLINLQEVTKIRQANDEGVVKYINRIDTIFQRDTILLADPSKIIIQKFIDTVYIEKIIATSTNQGVSDKQATIVVIDNQQHTDRKPKRKIRMSFSSFQSDTKQTKGILSFNK
ncbi:MAG: hypothetical protein K9J13_13225 [Saprospiraceae bacterium]|nr:hypothetical protein [Saprospiraceae bacterium]